MVGMSTASYLVKRELINFLCDFNRFFSLRYVDYGLGSPIRVQKRAFYIIVSMGHFDVTFSENWCWRVLPIFCHLMFHLNRGSTGLCYLLKFSPVNTVATARDKYLFHYLYPKLLHGSFVCSPVSNLLKLDENFKPFETMQWRLEALNGTHEWYETFTVYKEHFKTL